MDREHAQRNTQSRERLGTIIASASDEDLQRSLGDSWTVAAVLAHLAFWDQWVAARWDRYDRDGAIEDVPDGVVDLANAAGLPLWRAYEPRRAAALALTAAEAVDRRIEALPAAAVAHALATGRRTMVDRSLHRSAHLDEIEQRFAD